MAARKLPDEESPVRVGFMSPFAVDDPLSWSGVVSPMFNALASELDLVHLEVPDRSPHGVDRALARGLRRVYLPGIGLATSHSLGPEVARVVNESGVDVLLAVAASSAVAYAPIKAPVVEVSDATFRLLAGYYPMYADLHPLARWQGEAIVRRCARHSARFLLASDWAARSLVHDYGVAQGRVRVAPFGPSVTSPEPPPGPRPGQDLRLLFVGSDWVRKGGALAVEIADALNDAGTPCHLTVVGDAPDLPRHVRRVGRVPREQMTVLYATHDVLLEPALANAGGVTLTDATASGLPVVATRTGGVPAIVDDGVTGVLVHPGHVVPEAVAALTLLAVPERWHAMSTAALDRGRHVLSWATWARAAEELCREALESRH